LRYEEHVFKVEGRHRRLGSNADAKRAFLAPSLPNYELLEDERRAAFPQWAEKLKPAALAPVCDIMARYQDGLSIGLREL